MAPVDAAVLYFKSSAFCLSNPQLTQVVCEPHMLEELSGNLGCYIFVALV